jgi:N-methylhydantoinase A
MRPSLQHIHEQFLAAYEKLYGPPPEGRPIEIVTLRIRRIGKSVAPALPAIEPHDDGTLTVTIHQADGKTAAGAALSRAALVARGPQTGPFLLADPEATAYVPPNWRATARDDGSVILERA